MSDGEVKNRKNKKFFKKRSEKRKSRSRSPISKDERNSPASRDSRSSSRGTFDGIDTPPPPPPPPRAKSPVYHSCQQCRRTFETIRELAEHEIKGHDCEIICFHCDKKSVSVERLAAHTRHRHAPKPVICFYCQEPFGKSSELMSDDDWDEFREHIHKEAVKKQMYRHGITSNGSVAVAMRGVGACPHGPPVKCKNFPQCPGAKCIYSHNMCRYEATCNKSMCPFDHPNRPRTCMSCVNDMKLRKNFRH